MNRGRNACEAGTRRLRPGRPGRPTQAHRLRPLHRRRDRRPGRRPTGAPRGRAPGGRTRVLPGRSRSTPLRDRGRERGAGGGKKGETGRHGAKKHRVGIFPRILTDRMDHGGRMLRGHRSGRQRDRLDPYDVWGLDLPSLPIWAKRVAVVWYQRTHSAPIPCFSLVLGVASSGLGSLGSSAGGRRPKRPALSQKRKVICECKP